jgi:hypothetical protein
MKGVLISLHGILPNLGKWPSRAKFLGLSFMCCVISVIFLEYMTTISHFFKKKNYEKPELTQNIRKPRNINCFHKYICDFDEYYY